MFVDYGSASREERITAKVPITTSVVTVTENRIRIVKAALRQPGNFTSGSAASALDQTASNRAIATSTTTSKAYSSLWL
jgi:hypothetical protein